MLDFLNDIRVDLRQTLVEKHGGVVTYRSRLVSFYGLDFMTKIKMITDTAFHASRNVQEEVIAVGGICYWIVPSWVVHYIIWEWVVGWGG